MKFQRPLPSLVATTDRHPEPEWAQFAEFNLPQVSKFGAVGGDDGGYSGGDRHAAISLGTAICRGSAPIQNSAGKGSRFTPWIVLGLGIGMAAFWIWAVKAF